MQDCGKALAQRIPQQTLKTLFTISDQEDMQSNQYTDGQTKNSYGPLQLVCRNAMSCAHPKATPTNSQAVTHQTVENTMNSLL